MNETLVTMVGNVASAVSYSQTTGGAPVATFRMAATERRYDRGRGGWVDGDTTWVTVVAWRWLATNVVSSVNKGDPVVVSGRLRIREWGEEDKRRSAVEIDARSVGHDLARGTSAFRWAVQARPELVAPRPAARASLRRADGPGGPAALPAGAGAQEEVPDWIVAALPAWQAAEPSGGDPAPAEGPSRAAAEPGPVLQAAGAG